MLEPIAARLSGRAKTSEVIAMTALTDLPEQISRIIASSPMPATAVTDAFLSGRISEYPVELLDSYFSYAGGIAAAARLEIEPTSEA